MPNVRAESAALMIPEQAKHQPFFDLVANPQDWRAPINAWISPHVDQREVAAAVVFFTATVATFDPVSTAHGIAIHVTADGYRKGPAGP